MKFPGLIPLLLLSAAIGGDSASCDVDLVKSIGTSSPVTEPITIVSQDSSTVTFDLANTWGQPLDYVFVQYHDPVTGGNVCVPYGGTGADAVDNVFTRQIESGCMTNLPISVISVIVADPEVSGSASLPTCCGDGTLLGLAETANPSLADSTTSYTFVLECIPKSCAPSGPTGPTGPTITISTVTSAPSAAGATSVPTIAPTNAPKTIDEILDGLPKCADPCMQVATAFNACANIDVCEVGSDGSCKSISADWDCAAEFEEPAFVPTVLPPTDPTCECTDKSDGIVNDGFVTGAGWVKLDAGSVYVNEDYISKQQLIPTQDTMADYSFTAKYRGNLAGGSTNLVIGGDLFQFHSRSGGSSYYDGLEVPDNVNARWWGTGHLSSSLCTFLPSGDVYSFMVSVQDNNKNGGDIDTWRIRIWLTGSTEVIFDSNILAPVPNPIDQSPDECEDIRVSFQVGNVVPGFVGKDRANINDDRFFGGVIGALPDGDGNIHVIKAGDGTGVPLDDGSCSCDAPAADAVAGTSYVTGSGWIWLPIGANYGGEEFTGPEQTITCTFDALNTNSKAGGISSALQFGCDGADASDLTLSVDTDGTQFLEIPSPIEARWGGLANFAWPSKGYAASSADVKYYFYVSVQDYGAPGHMDTIHVIVWKIDDNGKETLWDGSKGYKIIDTDPEEAWAPVSYQPNNPFTFAGTRLGDVSDTAGGDGDVQIHWNDESFVYTY